MKKKTTSIFQSGSRQYRASVGDTVVLDKLALEPGSAVEFDQVLLVSEGGAVRVGAPTVSGAKVKAPGAGARGAIKKSLSSSTNPR